MKKIIFVLLFASLIFAQVDSHRDVYYYVDEDLNVDTTYIDYTFSGVDSTVNYINSFESEAKYIETKTAPGFILEDFEIKGENGALKVTMHGQYNSYVEQQGMDIKVGGKGFIDRTCKDFPVEIITPVAQSFHIEVHVPENFQVKNVPQEMHFDGEVIKIDYETKAENNILTEDIYFEVKGSATIQDYCNERDEINKGLVIGFTVSKQTLDSTLIIGIILAVVLIMLIISRFWK